MQKVGLLLFRLACFFTILTGILAFLASFQGYERAWLSIYNLLNFPDYRLLTFTKEMRIFNAMLGGVMIGWGATLFFLSDEILNSLKIWRAVLYGLIGWYVFDSLGSFVSGVPYNVLLNTGFLLFFLTALFFMKTKMDLIE